MCGNGCKTSRKPSESISGWRRVVTRRVSNTMEQSQRAERDQSQTEGDDHLADIEDGCGCTEVWEHMSEQRED